ncbi:class I SAM-dependent methyltransferase [Streptomyces sp. NPDC003077]|uniref:class I SAM-dependent methyltransferase n=1 Tax=Streptomyces sp. NPDC003077 TaxID=3154443 RepID=UPI0033B1BFE5
MASAVEHYHRLLAKHYTWMLGGDIPAAAVGQAGLLRELGVVSTSGNEVAVDLGCGSGAQTLALARLGFSPVIAVDTSAPLLKELALNAAEEGAAQAIRPVHRDIRGALSEETGPGTVTAVVCMGDTLLHLPGKADVRTLLSEIAQALRPGGRFIATYRDLTRELKGTDRFIPVRNTEDRLFTCFLDYQDEDTVMVHDLVHVRTGNSWDLQASSYPKLRLAPEYLEEQCRAAGLEVRSHRAGPTGMHVLHVGKP